MPHAERVSAITAGIRGREDYPQAATGVTDEVLLRVPQGQLIERSSEWHVKGLVNPGAQECKLEFIKVRSSSCGKLTSRQD
jgi:hypothetical protein